MALSSVQLSSYVKRYSLPLSVEYVVNRKHPEKRFHSHKFCELVLVLKGCAIHCSGGATAQVGEGDVLLIPPGVPHGYDRTDGFELANIVYDSDKMPIVLLDALHLPLFQRLFPDGGDFGEPASSAAPLAQIAKAAARRRIAKMIAILNDALRGEVPGKLFYSLSLFMEIIYELAQLSNCHVPESPGQFLLGDAIAYMNAHFNNPVSIDVLARRANMSRRNFFRQFKKEIGMSPHQFLLQLRLAHAEKLLLYSHKSISEIAIESGFTDGNYLSRQFRKKRAGTPGSLRRIKEEE